MSVKLFSESQQGMDLCSPVLNGFHPFFFFFCTCFYHGLRQQMALLLFFSLPPSVNN